MPGLDADGCYSALRAANYSVVARCGKPVPWARPLAGGPSEVLNPIGRCAFVTDRRCCHMADGAVWSIYRTDTLPPKAAFKARRRDFPQQVWLGESMENVDSYPSRPVGDQGYMDALDYAAYFGPGADFPVLPNYDYRNRIQRDLLAWPGRNVHFRTAAPLQQLLANKTGGVLYLSSDCVGLRGSQRDTFVKALMTYLHVDSLGKCLNNVPRADQHHSGSAFRASSATIMARYRFRLLIPNSLCEDYVVEKYSQALLHATIPIFLGAPNARRNYDPGVAAGVHPAAIYAEDFDGMAELAAHVARVASDRAEHARYFEWVGRTAEAWPTHYGEIEARRQGARSFMQYACERTLDGRRPGGGGASAQRSCHGSWRNYLKQRGKRLNRWLRNKPGGRMYSIT